MNLIQDFVSSVNGYAFTAISAVASIGIILFVWRIVAILVHWVKSAVLEHTLGRSQSYSWFRSFRNTRPWHNSKW